ncbi:TPA: type II toxin-antitoxin system HigA family antitoxin [Yersinia enterocolitica]
MEKTDWRIFKTQEDYERGMSRFLQLADGDLSPNTDDYDEFELLSLLIGHYESQKYPMDKPDPIDAIKFRMDQQGLSQSDMTQFIGSASKVSEVLNRKRPLSLSMIRRIHDGLGIPVDILIQDTNAVEWSYIDTLNKTVELDDNISQEDPLSTFTYINPLIKYSSRASIRKLFSRKNAPRISNALVAMTVNGKSVTSELTNHLTSTLSNDVFSRLS